MGCPFRSLVPITPRVASLGYVATLNDDTATRYENTEQSYTATCPEGTTGTPVEVVIPAGEFVSYQSQAIADAQALAQATEQAEAALVCVDDPLTLEAEFLIVRYSWSGGGTDLDTRTAYIDIDPSVNGIDVGWSRASYVDSGIYRVLTWGGDNTGNPGAEAVFIDFKLMKLAFPLATEFRLRCRAFWYSSRITGDFVLSGEAFVGGTINQVGTDFTNTGGVNTGTATVPCNVTTQTSTDVDGDEVATLVFDVATSLVTIIPA